VASVFVIGTGIFIQNKLKPTDGRFGVPQYLVFPMCGRSYMLSPNAYSTMARADANISPGSGSFILEPTIGKIPLTDLFTRCPMTRDGFYYTVVWLQVGPDTYAEYVLEGGP